MRLLLKIFAAPLIAALALLVWICSGLLYCTAFIFGLAGTIVAILGVAVLVTYSVQNGIILLVIAFLVSPMGLPRSSHSLGNIQNSGLAGFHHSLIAVRSKFLCRNILIHTDIFDVINPDGLCCI